MKTRKLGKTGPMLSEIGLGAWAIGGAWRWGWGKTDDNESVRTIHRAIDLGINWIDTAAVYGYGHSEKVVGKALKGRRNQVIVATKCGLVWKKKTKGPNDLSPQSIRSEVEDSLRRLQTDFIDIYQFHWPDPKVAVEDSWEEMIKLKEEGKVRWIGVSNFDVPLLKRCEFLHHVDSLQPPYNFLNRNVEKEIFPYCLKNGIGIIVYSPMASGILTGKFDRTKLAGDDWRQKSPEFREPALSQKLALVEKLRPIAAKYGKTVGQLAIAWVLNNRAVTSAIVGARRVKQVEENIGGSGWNIDKEDLKTIGDLLEEY